MHKRRLTSLDTCGIAGERRVPLDGDVAIGVDSTCSDDEGAYNTPFACGWVSGDRTLPQLQLVSGAHQCRKFAAFGTG